MYHIGETANDINTSTGEMLLLLQARKAFILDIFSVLNTSFASHSYT